LQDYFVCLHVLEPSDSLDNYNFRTRRQVVYDQHEVRIYGPAWMNEWHRNRLTDEIDGQREIFDTAIPGLYQEVQGVCHSLRTIQLEGKAEGRDEQSRQVAHQAAGLIAEVWCDPARHQLKPQALGCLWHLKSLIEVWGNFDLLPNESIADGADACFPEWADLSEAAIIQALIAISLSHALRRATYRRVSRLKLDEQVRQRALDILSHPAAIAQFQQVLGISLETPILPHWIRYRGFALCFHHCFWQAAYHAFRAACAEPDTAPPESYLKIVTSSDSVWIANRMAIQADNLPSARDREFYTSLQERMGTSFRIAGPQIITQEQINISQIVISLGNL
jgi:hypothetical protein